HGEPWEQSSWRTVLPLPLQATEVTPHLSQDDFGDILALHHGKDLQARMVLSSSTETACGGVLTYVDHGDAPLDAGQVGDDVFQIGELHIGNDEQIRGGTWYCEAQLIEIPQT